MWIVQSFGKGAWFIFRGGYRGGAPWPRMPRRIALSAPGGAHFTEKVPQVGQILRWKCPRWGRFCGESAPQHRCRTRYLPQNFFSPRRLKIPTSAPNLTTGARDNISSYFHAFYGPLVISSFCVILIKKNHWQKTLSSRDTAFCPEQIHTTFMTSQRRVF